MKNKITPVLREIVEKTVMSCGVDLYDIEFKGKTLQVLITDSNGISIDKCAKVSDALSTELDKQDLIPTRYFLEVSSPGVERRLRNQQDFKDSIGYTVSLHTQNGNFIGEILKVDDNGIEIKNTVGSSAKIDTVQYISIPDIGYARVVVTDDELFDKPKRKLSGGLK